MSTNGLSKTAAKQLDDLLKVIHEAKSSFNRSILEIGRALTEAKVIVEEHKQESFVDWVERECYFGKSTAYAYIGAFRTFGNFPKIGNFDDTAIYTLAKCEPAAAKAKALAHKGYRISADKAKELVKEVPPPPKKPKPPATKIDVSPSDTNVVDAVSVTFTCPNCGGTEADEDGDCAKCHEPPDREPGDDTEAIQSEAAKRKASGKEKVPPKLRKEALRALGVVIRFIDVLGRNGEAREALEVITAIVKGTA